MFVLGAAGRFFLCGHAWHTIPSCVHRSLRSLHVCRPLLCIRGHSKIPLYFVPVGLKVRAFSSNPSISKQSSVLATVGTTERHLCSSVQVHLPPGQVLFHSCPFSSSVGRVHHIWTQGFRSAVERTSPEFSRFYSLLLHGKKTLWEVWRLPEVAGV